MAQENTVRNPITSQNFGLKLNYTYKSVDVYNKVKDSCFNEN